MPDFDYAKGRIPESAEFISAELREFAEDYEDKTWAEYQADGKLQKLIDRTVENILTALIEICGTLLTEEGVGVSSYGEALSRCARLLGFGADDQDNLAKLAAQRNRLAHRYLDLRWQAIQLFEDNRNLIVAMLEKVLAREDDKGRGHS